MQQFSVIDYSGSLLSPLPEKKHKKRSLHWIFSSGGDGWPHVLRSRDWQVRNLDGIFIQTAVAGHNGLLPGYVALASSRSHGERL